VGNTPTGQRPGDFVGIDAICRIGLPFSAGELVPAESQRTCGLSDHVSGFTGVSRQQLMMDL
jgi:hypothetical protein